jgi:hypothetical protein
MQIIADLRAANVTVTQHPATGHFPWGMMLEHPDWGRAELAYPAEFPLPAVSLLRQSIGLTPFEQERACERRSLVILSMKTSNLSLLEATKRWLRWGRAAAGSTGTCLIDHHSERLWSIPALDSELSHNAPLDISALYAVRVYLDEDRQLRWLHTHGLAERGGFDLDIFDPNADMLGIQGHDILRAFAFRVLEGNLSPTSRRIRLLGAPAAQLVPWDVFLKRAPASIQALWNEQPQQGKRAVLVESTPLLPSRNSFEYQPYRGTSGPLENVIVEFSARATTLMQERAQATAPWLLSLLDTYDNLPSQVANPLEWKAFIKVGLRTDARLTLHNEHLWFRIVDRDNSTVTVRLESQPEAITRLTRGDVMQFDISQISGWMIRTRLGTIMPHDDRVARILSELSSSL